MIIWICLVFFFADWSVNKRATVFYALNNGDCNDFANKFAVDGRITIGTDIIQGRPNIRTYCTRNLKNYAVFKFFPTNSWVTAEVSVSFGHYLSVYKGNATATTSYTFLEFNDIWQIYSWSLL